MSFQTRIVGKDHFLSGVNYSGTDSPFTEADMYQIQSPPNTTRYKVEGYPVTIDMLADGYRAKGVVKLSLETFNTIVYFS